MAATKRAAKSSSIAERVTRQETLNEGLTSDVAEMKQALKEIQETLTKYKGFWGAVTLITGAIVTALTILWDTIATKMGWK